jgi:hypothetical protein
MMRNFFGQNTSESERDFPVIPDEQVSERSIPSERAVSGRGEGRIVYSHRHYATSYSLRLPRTHRGR